MQIEPVAVFHSPLKEKFGLPRQSGLATALRGYVQLLPPYCKAEALRGLEGFDYLWLIWGFNLNEPSSSEKLTVRPPRLGGNERVGVFASRSPFRPNALGLSSAKIESIDAAKGIIELSGADLADLTPIYDIKPYVEYADSHPGVRCGFVDTKTWQPLEVVFPKELEAGFDPKDREAIISILEQDPRPAYQDDPERVYGLEYNGVNLKFRVADGRVELLIS